MHGHLNVQLVCRSESPVSKDASLYKSLPTPIFLTSLIGPT